MKKVFLLPAKEDWIVDRFVKEWTEDNADITTNSPFESDVVWLLASWCWRHIPEYVLTAKKVIATIHHIVPEKFDSVKRADFDARDKVVTAYHVYNQVTHDFVRDITSKPVHIIPYWANQKLWHKSGNKQELRKKYGLPERPYLVGSFQRDTEGSDLVTPKLEKGPDLFVEFVSRIKNDWDFWSNGTGFPNPHVVLAGWRRQYVISRLKELNVGFTYFDRPSQEVLNELYQTLDLYPVSSRCEGGPQSLIECGLLGVPVVSRNVGIASQVLPPSAINDDIYFATPKKPIVDSWRLPQGYMLYRQLIESL